MSYRTNCESLCLIVTHHDTLGLTMTYMILIPEVYEVYDNETVRHVG